MSSPLPSPGFDALCPRSLRCCSYISCRNSPISFSSSLRLRRSSAMRRHCALCASVSSEAPTMTAIPRRINTPTPASPAFTAPALAGSEADRAECPPLGRAALPLGVGRAGARSTRTTVRRPRGGRSAHGSRSPGVAGSICAAGRCRLQAAKLSYDLPVLGCTGRSVALWDSHEEIATARPLARSSHVPRTELCATVIPDGYVTGTEEQCRIARGPY